MDRRQWRETFFPGSGQGALKIQRESIDARPLTPPTIPAPVLPPSNTRTLPIPPPPPSETARAYARKRPKTKDASPSSADASVRSARLLPIQRGYPWKKYQKEWALGLKGTVSIAYNVHVESELVAIREYRLNNDLTPAVVQMLQHIRHKNVVDLRELYNQHSSLYTVMSYMDISVEHLIACPKFPTEEQIATIICEVFSALAYLHSLDLAHEALECAAVLLSRNGEVRLTNLHACAPRAANQESPDVRATGHVMLSLMEKQLLKKSEEVFRASYPSKWTENANAFLLETQNRAADAVGLLKHRFLNGQPQPHTLTRLVEFAKTSAFKIYHVVDAPESMSP